MREDNCIRFILFAFTNIFIAFCLYFIFDKIEKTKPLINVGLVKEQAYRLFEDAYDAGYRKGRHYARINKFIPFDLDVEEDSALIMKKYFNN
jgi:hypothetical protein